MVDDMANNILKAFKKQYPDRHPTSIRELNSGYFIIAPAFENKPDFGDPFFMVDNTLTHIGFYRYKKVQDFLDILRMEPIWTSE